MTNWTLEDKTSSAFVGTLKECLQFAGIEDEASYSQRVTNSPAEYFKTGQISPDDFLHIPDDKVYKRIRSVALASGKVSVGNYTIKLLDY